MIVQERIASSLIGGMEESLLDWYMKNWARWMRHDVSVNAYPKQSIGFVAGGYSSSFDEMCDAADVRAARAVDALVLGLNPAEKAAIHHTYLRAVFRFPRGNFPELLSRARSHVARGMRSRGF